MDRRSFLKTGAASLVAAGLARPLAAGSAETSGGTKWRTFEVTTRLEILKPSGPTRGWVPMPLMPDTDYQKSLGQSWTGNASANAGVPGREVRRGHLLRRVGGGAAVRLVVEVTTRFATRDRAVDLSAPGNPAPEDKAVLKKYLAGTKFIPIDGIVRKQALEVTKGASTDVDKARLSTSGSWTTPSAIPRFVGAASATSRRCSRRAI